MRYEPSSEKQVEWAVGGAGIDPNEFCFIDMGCGKGRPLIVASRFNFAELVGVEYSGKLCNIAEGNLRKLGIPARVVCQDAATFAVPRRDIFAFFYHPFGPVVLGQVLDNLRSGNRVVVAYIGDDSR